MYLIKCLMPWHLCFSEFCKQAAMYNPQVASYYYQQLYGPTSPSAVGPPPYHHYPHMGYSMQSPRAGFPSLAQGPRPPYMQQHPAPHMQGSFIPSSSQQHPFQLQPPPHARQPLSTAVGKHHPHPLPSFVNDTDLKIY